MSVTSAATARSAGAVLSRRLIACVLALLLVAGVVALLAMLIASVSPPPPLPPRNPFGTALPREALPSTTGFGAAPLAWQSSFYRELTATLKAIATAPAALWGLLSSPSAMASSTRPVRGTARR
ncbi:Nickel/cobalt efflux system OS=Bosea thiooxidans OX=53254 GN=ARD30_22935 PE=3 SV=1 [Bosea thiooxidans]